MNEMQVDPAGQARHQIAERVARASSPRVRVTSPHRHRLAARLRRYADRLES